MTNEIPHLGIGAKVALAIIAVAVAVLFGYAAGDAFDNDGLAHSHQAFGTEFDPQE